LKTKDLLKSLKKILGSKIFKIAIKNKKIRPGKGKRRGRKYKRSAGMIFITGDNEELKTKLFDVVNVNQLRLDNLAKGGTGRLAIYTEEAIKDLNKVYGDLK
jgi:large subunit ribosomal protein L4e